MAHLTSLLSAEQIHQRVKELGKQIAQDYAGKELVLVCILKGSFIFMADLCREISIAQEELHLPQNKLRCEFLGVQSYGDVIQSLGVVQITVDLTRPIANEHILIIEDIIDSGLTMSYLLENLKTRHPASIKICALLHKPARTVRPVSIDYLAFTIDDLFVCGYGLDYKQQYRNIPYVGVLEGVS